MVDVRNADGTSLLSVKVDGSDSRVVVHLIGELDVSAAPLLQATLVDVLKDSPEELVLDLEDLSYIDSTGLSLFVSTTKRVRASGNQLVLQNPGATTRRLLEVTSLTEFFSIR